MNKSHFTWYLYIVCCKDGTLYTGISKNVEARIACHNRGKGAKYTRGRRPVKLLAFWDFPDKSSALKAECQMKKLKRIEKLQQIQDHAKKETKNFI